ncbi:GYD domain-containing protein [Roseomonas eburnea]|uniref:GYD domain-containing protein n=1 Tax=Neoroseomonas eburnea TaxID=1346889 RepID=A0A9X9XKJ1_9PROT|nr:GYD domain-containing protein [Neoroseomonas eburnea]MBR0684227.1 GYD domain-containing protein [Neoroseomonas eburnea]
MTTYIMLGNWTDQGVRAIADSPRRLDAAKTMIEEMGGRFSSFHMTMGEVDFILQIEAPDDAVAARFALMLGRMGNVRTKTLKAFPEQAYRQIVATLG